MASLIPTSLWKSSENDSTNYYTPLPTTNEPTPKSVPQRHHKSSHSWSSANSSSSYATTESPTEDSPVDVGHSRWGRVDLPEPFWFSWYYVKSRWREHISPLAGALMIVLLIVFALTMTIVVLVLKRPRYNPLDNYQNLNHIPLVTSNTTTHEERAVVSTLYTDSYALSVAVLAHSIRKAGANARLILGYLEDRVSPEALCIAQAAGWTLLPLKFIPPPHNGSGISQRFTDQYTKLNIWGLDKIGIQRLVYLDADTLVRRNFDELFEAPWDFAAVPDVYDKLGFVVAFNAGVMALRTSSEVLEDMKVKIGEARFPRSEAEQAFLNVYYGPKAVRLPYAYNGNLAIKQRSETMWKGLGDEMRIVHYTVVKPFLIDFKREHNFLFSADEMRKVVREAAVKENGMFKDEVGWWGDAFEGMWTDSKDKITACY